MSFGPQTGDFDPNTGQPVGYAQPMAAPAAVVQAQQVPAAVMPANVIEELRHPQMGPYTHLNC